jgi:hypothetical protein
MNLNQDKIKTSINFIFLILEKNKKTIFNYPLIF